MKRALAALSLLLVLSLAPLTAAQDLAQAKAYFKAGAAAYEVGDYLAAIQALEAAYRLTPLPAIAFSLAQAERRQYFVSHDRSHLERAITLFRSYLQVSSGGRRADATDALGQLELLATSNASAAADSAAGPQLGVSDRTRLMISSAAPKASIVLDGAPPQASPLIAQVTPGMHRVVVTAQGHFPSERSVEAFTGELVPLEVTLREQPARVMVRSYPESGLMIDGAYVGDVGSVRTLQLTSGSHSFSFAKNGHRVETVEANLPPGATRDLTASLSATAQRKFAVAAFIASGVGVIAGSVFTGLAVDREHAAVLILDQKAKSNITGTQLEAYRDAVQMRERMRVAAVGGFVIAAGALVTGLVLFAFDQPELRESTEKQKPQIEITVPGEAGMSLGLALRGRF